MSEGAIDLNSCAREPIHIPGSIQPHGLMFVLREPELTILQVSDNLEEFLGVKPEEVVGKDLSVILDAERRERVQFALDSVDPRDNNPVDLQLPTKNGVGPLDGFVHRHDGFSFLEMEPASLAHNARFLEFYKTISKLTSRMHATKSIDALLDEAVRGVRGITGFDKVMLYRFAEDYEGEVVAEAKADDVDSYLGLWFPASDIPEQARRLYVLNPVRSIADAAYKPSRIVPSINPESKQPTDLTFAGLRSVSPVHCEYLKNMGVSASMSISVLRDERLWGLIACHHFAARMVPYEVRKACGFIGEVLSREIARRETEVESEVNAKTTTTLAKFIEQMAASANPLQGLIDGKTTLLELLDCDGAAVVEGQKADMLGSTPGYGDVMKLADSLDRVDASGTFSTRCLKRYLAINEETSRAGAGLIALRIDRKPRTFVFFFRPEVVETVSWGGNPSKAVIQQEDGFRISPRKSFAVWKEELRDHARPWTASEIRAAGELRNLISVVTYARGG